MTRTSGSGHRSAFRLQGIAALLGLAVSVALLSGNTPALAKKSAASWPVRDFLPPVASINPTIDPQQPAKNGDDNDLGAVNYMGAANNVIHTHPRVEKLDSPLAGVKSEQLQNVLEMQKKIDTADMEYLWQATVDKNPVIRFSLEKLNTPADLQSKHSSLFMRKVLPAMISVGEMGSSFLLPGNGYTQMGTNAAGQALQNMATGQNKPQPVVLSPTEQIQMAGLIDNLKTKLIQNYQDYKTTLQSLAESHTITIKNNNIYSKALTSKNDLAIMAAGTAYYQALSNETALRQKAKMYRLELERLAGADAVNRLELSAHVDTDTRAASNTPTSSVGPVIGPEPAPDLNPEDIGPPAPPPPAPADNKPVTHKRPKSSSAQTTVPASPQDGLPQPLEIGPSLHQESVLPMPDFPAAIQHQTMASGASDDSAAPVASLSETTRP